MTETTLSHPDNREPTAFTQEELGWLPWLEPFPAEQLTERHWAGLVDASRAKSPYFLLLARDPDILQARTKTDKDIFYNTSNGLPARRAGTRSDGHLTLTTAASSARPSIPGSPRNIPSGAPTFSACSMRASRRTSTAAGTPSSQLPWH